LFLFFSLFSSCSIAKLTGNDQTKNLEKDQSESNKLEVICDQIQLPEIVEKEEKIIEEEMSAENKEKEEGGIDEINKGDCSKNVATPMEE